MWVSPLEGHRFNTLLFYFSVLGRNYLSDQMVEFAKLNPVQKETEEIPLTQAKIGEDITAEYKPKTLKEFLNYGKTISGR